jgi:transcriptional regulator with XRE-family HTH domain
MINTFPLEKLGRRFKALRQNHGLTQLALAQRAAVTRMKVIAIEAGSASVAVGGYARVAAALGVELDVVPLSRPTLDDLAEVFGGEAS